MKPFNSYSVETQDDPVLEVINPQLANLTTDQQVAIAIAALFEAYEPDSISFDYEECTSRHYDKSVELIQLLSKPGKLALCRAVLEHLAVAEWAQKGTISSTSGGGPSSSLEHCSSRFP